MNSLILSFFAALVWCFHLWVNSHIKSGKIKEGFCALWCIDAVFAVCGTIISFAVYRYTFFPFLTVRNFIIGGVYLIITLLFLLLAPSGFSLLVKKKAVSEETLLLAEYSFNDTLCLVRNFFLALLFVLPILFVLMSKVCMLLEMSFLWQEDDVCGGFCFTAFLLLLPISLRQTLFWLKNLVASPTETEGKVLKQYRAGLHYRHKNRIL